MAFLSAFKKNFKSKDNIEIITAYCMVFIIYINISHKKYFSIYQYNLYLQCNIIYRLINI